MSHSNRSADGIIADVVSAIVAETGYPVTHVKQFVAPAMRYVLREYGGDRLPKVTRIYHEEAIIAAVRSGKPKRQVCRQFRIGTGTLYRIMQDAADNQRKNEA